MKNFKLPTIIFLLIIASILPSCNGVADPDKCLASVKVKFPHAKVYSKYGSNITFIVIDSAGVKLVETGSIFYPSVTSVEILSEQ